MFVNRKKTQQKTQRVTTNRSTVLLTVNNIADRSPYAGPAISQDRPEWRVLSAAPSVHVPPQRPVPVKGLTGANVTCWRKNRIIVTAIKINKIMRWMKMGRSDYGVKGHEYGRMDIT